MPEWLPSALAALGPVVAIVFAYLYGRDDGKSAPAQKPTTAPDDDGVRAARVVIEKALAKEVKVIKKTKKASDLASKAKGRSRK
tara:strand:+ start:723 stop:974 length:252 start_codon:yes stop_codon:yes gene_type:complete